MNARIAASHHCTRAVRTTTWYTDARTKHTTHHRYRFEQSVQARVPRWKLNPQGAACHGPYPDPNSRRRWFRDTGERAVPGLRRSWGARCRHCGYRRLRQRHGLGKTRHVGSAAHVHVKHVGATGGCTRVAQRPGRPDIPCQPICLLTKLRFLSVRFLGLDGSTSHTGTRSDTLALKHCVATLNDLRWLYPMNNDYSEKIFVSRPFVAKLMEEHPNLAKKCYDKLGRPRQLEDLCVSGKLWKD